MPSSIPYNHSSLVLGNIIDTRVLDLLKKIDGLLSKSDAAQDKMNSFIMMKRSLAMTLNELTDMNVDVTGLKAKLTELDSSITSAAQDYMMVSIANETNIQQMREQISELELGDTMESPVDFTASTIKYLPLSAESINLDSQYFSFATDSEDDTIASIEKYIRESTSNLGPKSDDIAKAAASQLNRQKKNHSISGTLIITASCTHKNVAVIDPFVVDADKAIAVWNVVNSSATDKIDISDPMAVKSILDNTAPENENFLTVISGAAYGSSFVGMVHFLKTEMAAIGNIDTAQIQEKLRIGGWLENMSGGFGIEPSVADEVKKMLNTQGVSSHVSMIVMGAVPSIASNQLKSGLSSFLSPDPAKLKEYLSVVENPASTNDETVDSAAGEAKSVNRLVSLQNATTKSIIGELGKIDTGANKVIDINSMMAGFENYLQSIRGANPCVGAPINFYLKKLTRSQVAQSWVDKYYPSEPKGASKNESNNN